MRIAYVNKSDTATLTASSKAGSLIVDNLKSTYKSEVWRSVGGSATLEIKQPEGKQISVISLPFCSLSSAATVRITAFTNSADVIPAYDSGIIVAIPPMALTEWPWGSTTLGVNSYAYGLKATMVKWIPVGAYKKIVIELDDALNPLGYIEAGRLFCSSYYEFEINADFGSTSGTTDNSTFYRNDSSDLLTDRGITFKTLSVSLSSMRQADRTFFSNILKMSSSSFPVLLSIFPENTDSVLEEEHQIYGKLTRPSTIAITNIDRYAGSLELEEV